MTWFGIVWVLLGVGIEAPGSELQQEKLAVYPTAGVAFRQPSGWHEQLKDKAKSVAWWISPDSKPGKPTAAIMIECAHPKDASLDEVARGLAGNFHGVVDDHPASLGGTRALRIIATNDSQALRPVEAVATIHDGRLYLIMGGAIAGHSVKDELESIRASWTWSPIEQPFKHLAFRDKPLSLAGGAASINVPKLMHTYPTDEPDRVLDLGIHNFVRNAPDFLAYAQVAPIAQGMTFEEYKSRLSDGLQAKGVISKPFVWGTLNDMPTRVISDTIEVKTAEKPGGPKIRTFIRWALVKLDDHRVVSVNFTIPADAPGDRSTYIRLAEQIADSVRTSAAAVEPKPKEINPSGADR